MTVLITFLGKNRRDPKTGYQLATYRFENGETVTTAFFGSALMRHLRPDRTLLLGTAGSMWDALDFDTDAPEWSELVESTDRGDVDQRLLDRVSSRARESMSGAELVLMPYARTEGEQMTLLADLADRVGVGEHVVLDITHGFRHLPVLVLVAARYLSHVRKAFIDGIYYGAWEMKGADGMGPVLKLDGLLHMLDWIEAFAAHDASGSYAGFAPLLMRDGLKPGSAERLIQAAHLERVTNASKARENLTPMLEEIGQLSGATALFTDQLLQRLSWVRKPDRQARELALHEAYLARGDFLRAAIYLQESAISAECRLTASDANIHAQREVAREALKVSPAFRSLSDIRNSLAHGTVGGDPRRTKAVKDATASAETLSRRLRELRHDLTA